MLNSLSVFFPANNEVGNIQRSVDRALEVLPDIAKEYEIIVVDDGSTDGTGELADRLAREGKVTKVVHHPKNRGYGAALRSGFESCKYPYIFYTDGDCQFDIGQIARLLPLLDVADIVAGYRVKRRDPLYRIVNGIAYNLLVRSLFRIKFKDINCAFKLIKKRVIDDIKLRSEGQSISVELLVKAGKRGFVIEQVGVGHYPRISNKSSGNRPDVVVKGFRELFRLWRNSK